MHSSTRRQFLETGTCVAGMLVGAPLLSRSWALSPTKPEVVLSVQDPQVKALVQTGLDAARAAGAPYAEVCLSHFRFRGGTNVGVGEGVNYSRLDAGVRVLMNGYWGFASGPVWSTDELVRLGHEAARQARVNALGRPRDVMLPRVPVVHDGHWETPVKRDPWTVPVEEIGDTIEGLGKGILMAARSMRRFGDLRYGAEANIQGVMQSRDTAFGTTEGSYFTQRHHWVWGRVQYIGGDGDLLTGTAAGWEHFAEQPLVESTRQRIEAAERKYRLPQSVIDVGRYDVVFDAKSVARLLSRTIGVATELDRVMGYEANATGTSYITDPSEMLGTFKIGSPLLTVTANRSERGGMATTKWDAEGVTPREMTLIKGGVLTDLQTHREGAGWIRTTVERQGFTFQSNGCAESEHAAYAPLVRTANLVMASGEEALDVRELEAGIKNGLSVEGADFNMDFQCGSGESDGGTIYKIENGKRVGRFSEYAAVSFRTLELWKNLIAIGGQMSAKRFGIGTDTYLAYLKGTPEQRGLHSVTAVPIVVKEMAFISKNHR